MNKALYICRIVKTHKLVQFSGPHSYLGPSCSREFTPRIDVLKVRLNYIYCWGSSSHRVLISLSCWRDRGPTCPSVAARSGTGHCRRVHQVLMAVAVA